MQPIDMTGLMDGLPPHSLEAEKSTLGAILLDPSSILKVFSIIEPSQFYRDAHGRIAGAVSRLALQGHAGIDTVAVAEELDSRGDLEEIGGLPYLIELMESVPNTGHAEYYAGIVLEKWRARCLREFCIRTLKSVTKSGVVSDETFQAAHESLSRIQDPAGLKASVRKLQPETLREIVKQFTESEDPAGQNLIETGLVELDDALDGGFEYGEFVIMGARPGNGKSMVGLQLIHNWTARGIPCAFVSEEMSNWKIAKRTTQFMTPVPSSQWADKRDEVRQSREIHFHNRAECYVIEFCKTVDVAVREIRKLVKDHGVRCVVVDYAQLLGGRGNSIYERITNMSMELRRLANELNLVLVALAQTGRDVEKRGTYEPRMSDLKESGQLEQDADVIIFLVWSCKSDKDAPPDKFCFHIAKNRGRAINQDVATCRFDPRRQMILGGQSFQLPEGF